MFSSLLSDILVSLFVKATTIKHVEFNVEECVTTEITHSDNKVSKTDRTNRNAIEPRGAENETNECSNLGLYFKLDLNKLVSCVDWRGAQRSP